MAHHPTVPSPRSAAALFLENGREEVPLGIEQIDILLRVISAARERLGRFLCLGDDSVLAAAAMLDEYPSAHGVLVARADASLAGANRCLELEWGRIACRKADYADPRWLSVARPAGPFDAMVCAFATHAFDDRRLREFYREVFELLTPGGVFLNIEHVTSATRWSGSTFDDLTIGAVFGGQLKNAGGASRAEIARRYYASRMDTPPLEVQCDWLRECGFESVDCYSKVRELAVFGGQRPEREPAG